MPYTYRQMRQTKARHYARNKERYIKAAKIRRLVNRALVTAAKGGPCVDCGRRFPTVCMDLDHVRGAKKFELGNSAGRNAAAVIDEIAKCDAVCSNCHRIRTFSSLA